MCIVCKIWIFDIIAFISVWQLVVMLLVENQLWFVARNYVLFQTKLLVKLKWIENVDFLISDTWWYDWWFRSIEGCNDKQRRSAPKDEEVNDLVYFTCLHVSSLSCRKETKSQRLRWLGTVVSLFKVVNVNFLLFLLSSWYHTWNLKSL